MQQLVFGDGKENCTVILEETEEREGNYIYMDHKGRADCGCNRDLENVSSGLLEKSMRTKFEVVQV